MDLKSEMKRGQDAVLQRADFQKVSGLGGFTGQERLYSKQPTARPNSISLCVSLQCITEKEQDQFEGCQQGL